MNDEMFNELLESVKQAGEIRKGLRKPSRYTVIEEPDVAAIREKYGMTQQEFSSLLGISIGTLRNWERSEERRVGREGRGRGSSEEDNEKREEGATRGRT